MPIRTQQGGGDQPDSSGLLGDLATLGIPVDQLDLSSYLPAAVTAAAEQTSQQYNPHLPAWVQRLRSEVQAEVADPYMRVFWGGTKTYDFGTQEVEGVEFDRGLYKDSDEVDRTEVTEPKTVSVDRAMSEPYRWSDQEVADAMDRFKQAGIPVSSFDDLEQAWGSLVQRAALTFSATKGDRALTPWDVLDLYKSEAQAAGTWVDPNRTETQVSRSINEITEGQAWASLQGTLSQMLGRDPSDQELRDFTYRMNRLAAENPTITKTVQRYKDGDLASTTSRSSGGFTASDLAQEAYDDAQSDPEYAEFQAATTYFSALQQALGAIGG